jgi:tetrachlorobenzoquinone reductase
MPVILTGIRRTARDTNLFTFERLDGDALPAAEAGAHIILQLPNKLVRQYSLVDPQRGPTSYTIGVKHIAHGRGGSSYLHNTMRVGDQLRLLPPRNHFPLNEDAKETVLFAGGIGITPIYAMIQRLRALGRTYTLHYACRSRADMAFLKELSADPRFHHLHFDDTAGAPLPVAGLVRAAGRDAHLYCCGPGPMLAAFEAAANDRAPETVHVEYFRPKAEPAAAASAPAAAAGFTVELARSQRSLFIPAGASILAVLRAADVAVSYSCEMGVCGTCETKVLHGIPDHKDSILTASEQASNSKIMICCSGAKSDRLVLDL